MYCAMGRMVARLLHDNIGYETRGRPHQDRPRVYRRGLCRSQLIYRAPEVTRVERIGDREVLDVLRDGSHGGAPAPRQYWLRNPGAAPPGPPAGIPPRPVPLAAHIPRARGHAGRAHRRSRGPGCTARWVAWWRACSTTILVTKPGGGPTRTARGYTAEACAARSSYTARQRSRGSSA